MNLTHVLKTGSLVMAVAACGSPPKQDSASMLLGNGDSEECYKGDEFICAAEKEITRLNNVYREQNGRSALANSGHMGFVSRAWSETQGRRGSIGHDGFPSQRSSKYVDEFGSMEGVWISGENVAYFGPSGGLTAEEVGRRLAQMWWNSSGHRANMLGNHTGVGAGVYKTAGGHIYGTQIFYKMGQ